MSTTTPPPTNDKTSTPFLDEMDASTVIQQVEQTNPFEENSNPSGADQSFYQDANPDDFGRLLQNLQDYVLDLHDKVDTISAVVDRVPANILLPVQSVTPSGRKSVSFHPDIAAAPAPKKPIGDRLGGKVPVSAPHTAIKVNKPKPFSGQRSEAEDFVFQCELNFDAMAAEPSERNKMTFFASYLAGHALHCEVLIERAYRDPFRLSHAQNPFASSQFTITTG